MARMRCWWLAVVFLVGGASSAGAGPYIGEWGWWWHPARDCPQGDYSALHQWLPGIYRVRACVHPSNLDQYPPGALPCGPVPFETVHYPCRSTPAAPTAPYATPTGYFGRPVALPFSLP